MDVVERIDALCAAQGTNRNRLEIALCVSHGSIAKWRSHAPSADIIYRASRFLGATMEYLLTGEEELPESVPLFSSRAAAVARLYDQADARTRDAVDLLLGIDSQKEKHESLSSASGSVDAKRASA